MSTMSTTDRWLAPSTDEVPPEAPPSSQPVHPGLSWFAESSSHYEFIKQQLTGIQERLDAQAEKQPARFDEILTRLDMQAELLKDLVKVRGAAVPQCRRNSTQMSSLLLTYETAPSPPPEAKAIVTEEKRIPSEGKAANLPAPGAAPVTPLTARVGSMLSSFSGNRVAAKSKRGSLRAGTGLFTTFTEADLALRQRAAEVDSQVSRKRITEASEVPEEQKEPGRLQNFVQHPAFDSFFAIVVIINCFFIAIEVQESIWSQGQSSLFLMIAQFTFTFLFAVELALRFMAFGCQLLCGEEWTWILLDTVIVASALTEMILTLVQYMMDEGNGTALAMNLSGFKAFRIIRVTRILKTLRLARIFRFIMALRTLVTSIIYTLKSLFWAMALLMLIVFVFAVLLVEAVSDHWGSLNNPSMPADDAWRIEAYFASLPHAMLALFMSISGGVSWEEVIAPLANISPVWVVVYLFYISFTYFAVLNVVTGVFCQSAIDSAQNDHANVVQSMLANKEAHVEKIKELFSRLGADDTGVITYGMFEEGIQTQAVIEYFESLGLDIWDAWSFFKLLDLDAGGSVEIEEFFKGCLRLRGQARGVDLGKLLHDQRWLIKAQGRFQAYVEAKLGEMCDVLDQLTISNGVPKLAKNAPSNFMRGISPINLEERNA